PDPVAHHQDGQLPTAGGLPHPYLVPAHLARFHVRADGGEPTTVLTEDYLITTAVGHGLCTHLPSPGDVPEAPPSAIAFVQGCEPPAVCRKSCRAGGRHPIRRHIKEVLTQDGTALDVANLHGPPESLRQEPAAVGAKREGFVLLRIELGRGDDL